MSESILSPDPHTEVDVGERVRTIRHLRRLTLKEIAERTGLSESFLSQAERGLTSASIASLQRIAAALGVAVSDLFAPDNTRRPRVSRREARQFVAWGELGRKALLTPKPFHHLEVVVAELDAGGSTGDEPYRHGDSEEVFFVLSGRVRLQLADETYELGPGDSVQYRSSTPHRVVNPEQEPAEVMFVVSPPSY
ncbi:MAG TPA: cupin domain-containing protein [Gaiellaceae bacterium]|nr:cupin domain-containing protein [Gaiellaceae bacterium]